jgi:hypothetical protein
MMRTNASGHVLAMPETRSWMTPALILKRSKSSVRSMGWAAVLGIVDNKKSEILYHRGSFQVCVRYLIKGLEQRRTEILR